MDSSTNWRQKTNGSGCFIPRSSMSSGNTNSSQNGCRTISVKKKNLLSNENRKCYVGSGRLRCVINKEVAFHELETKLEKYSPFNNYNKKSIEKQHVLELLNKDAYFLLHEFAKGTLVIEALLDVKDLEPPQLVGGLQIIAKALTCNNRNLVSNLLQKLAFSKHLFIITVSILVGKKLSQMYFDGDKEFLSVALDLLNLLIMTFPSSAIDILDVLFPQITNLIENGLLGEDKESVLEKVQILQVQKEEFAVNFEGHTKGTSRQIKTLPPCDFRSMPNIPDRDEALKQSKPFLRPVVLKGTYKDVEQYLDIHFRLMREDMFHDFKQCLLEYFDGEVKSGYFYTNAHFEMAECGAKDVIWKFLVPVPTRLTWEVTKRLAPSSLICISCDGFSSFCFATIESRYPVAGTTDMCSLFLKFESEYEINLNVFDSYDIIETSSFYESYRYVYDRLKCFNELNFPLGNCLINFHHCDLLPLYLKTENVAESIKRYQAEIIDEQQSKAFELALKNKVALIQGPPGTGKSYIGVQLVRYLIENVSVKKPLIVMCYTNHALDQFLEKIMYYTKKIIRIGGQSKCCALKPHNLQDILDSMLLVKSYFRPWSSSKGHNLMLTQVIKKIRRASNKEQNDLEEAFNGHYNLDKSLEELLESLTVAASMYDKYFSDYTNYLYLAYKEMKDDISSSLHNIMENTAYPFLDYSFINETCGYDFACQILNLKSISQNQILHLLSDSTLEEKIHMWLCIYPSFSKVYNKMNEFRETLTQKLFMCIQLRVTNKSKEKPGPVSYIGELLLKLCDYDTFITVCQKSHNGIIPYSRQKYTEHAIKFVQLYSDRKAFSLFQRSAVFCCNKNGINTNFDCENLWQLSILHRWNFLAHSMRDLFLKKFKREYVKWDSGATRSCFDKVCSYQLKSQHLKLDKSLCCRKLLERADIIGLTVTGGAKNCDLIHNLKPTTFIIEEAAEVLESHIVTALTSTTDHMILIGDHLQLKPSPNVFSLAVKYKMDVSLFERLFKNGVPSVCLEVQHRMRPSISQLLVPEFYNCLQDHHSVTEYENVIGMSSNVFFLQHTELEAENVEMKSHSNYHEAKFVVSLCQYLVSQGNMPNKITILTTYVGQLRLIIGLMRKNNVELPCIITTVDNYQGEENDIIILSFVRSNKENNVGFIKIGNRVCVALSRAKKGLYCIGNFEMFATESTIWVSLIEKLKKMDCFGEKLSLQCQNHPTVQTQVSCSEDLLYVMKKGCKQTCNVSLPCGHSCSLACHIGSNMHHSLMCVPSCIAEVYKNEDKGIQLPGTEDYERSPAGSVSQESGETYFHTGDKDSCNALLQHTQECLFPSNNGSAMGSSSNIHEKFFTYMKCGKAVEHLPGEKPKHADCMSEVTLPCLHKIPCFMYTDSYKCVENVEQKLSCGHSKIVPCSSTEQDLVCEIVISKIKDCGHVINVQCSLQHTLAEIQCEEKIEIIFPCNHTAEMMCYEKESNVFCKKSCDALLPCGHQCVGTCHSCNSSLKHEKCKQKIYVGLSCGHNEMVICGSPLPTCKQQCMFQCAHFQCINPCTSPCMMCSQPCIWQCEHLKCARYCGELCDRPPCNEPCILNVSCGHLCPGFCGEPCPELCARCNGYKSTSRLVLLEDCGHLIEEKLLSNFLVENKETSPQCPQCYAVITRNTRFGNFLKSYLKDRHKKLEL